MNCFPCAIVDGVTCGKIVADGLVFVEGVPVTPSCVIATVVTVFGIFFLHKAGQDATALSLLLTLQLGTNQVSKNI